MTLSLAGKIFLIQGNDTLHPLTEEPYTNEDLLQTLLEKHPDLLAGEQINASAPRRWLLVSREFGVPGEDAGLDRWSLDHLFLDQDGVPTLVEVKRSSDTRIRREVVGQMLDYAANAVVYCPVAALRARFEAACERRGEDAAERIGELIGSEPSEGAAVDSFWEQVKTNLQAGRIRLIFVADQIPAELRRIVEFLNAHMDPVEVLAVEIRQFVGEGIRTLVPRVIGLTAEAEQRKAAPTVRERRQWDEETLLADLRERRGAAEVEATQRILRWARERQLRVWWGKGHKDGSFFPMLDHKGVAHFTVAVWTYGRVETQFQHMKTRPPLADETLRLELLRRLNLLPGVSLPPDSIHRRPSFPLAALVTSTTLDNFLETLDWVVDTIKAS